MIQHQVSGLGVCVTPGATVKRTEEDCQHQLHLLPHTFEMGSKGDLQCKLLEVPVLMVHAPAVTGIKNDMPKKIPEKTAATPRLECQNSIFVSSEAKEGVCPVLRSSTIFSIL